MEKIGCQSKILWIRDLFRYLESDGYDDGFKLAELRFYAKHGIITEEEAVELVLEYGIRKENDDEH